MIRNIFAAALTLVSSLLLLSIATPKYVIAKEKTPTTIEATTESSSVTENYALLVSLEHAGFVKDDLLYSSVEKDTEDGASIYEVEFQVGHQNYQYEVDATTGDIISYELDD